MLTLPSYVLITPARNEAEFIGLTIESVLAQTVRPIKWVIVSDGSTDATSDIVRRYAVQHGWIELLELPMGCKYTITTPLSLRIEDGKITCAQEGDHKECLGLK